MRICWLPGRWRWLLLLSLGIAAAAGAGTEPRYSAIDLGVPRDGHTDCTPAIARAVHKIEMQGGGTLVFPKGEYVLRRSVAGSPLAAIRLPNGVCLDGGGSRFLLEDNCSFIGNAWRDDVFATIVADVGAGQSRIRVDDPGLFQAGDEVGMRLGDNKWDAAETRKFRFARVTAVAEDGTLQLDAPLDEALAVAETHPKNRRVIRFRAGENPVYEGGRIANVVLVQGKRGNAEAGIDLRYSRHVTVENVVAENPGAGGVLMAYGFHNRVTGLRILRSARGGHPAKGRAVNLWNCEDCEIADFSAREIENCFAFVESYCRDVRFRDVEFEQTTPPATGNQAVFFVVQGSTVSAQGVRITGSGRGLVLFDCGGSEASFTYSDLSISTKEQVLSVPLQEWTGGELVLEGRTFRHADVRTSTFEGSALDHLPDGLWLGLWTSGSNTGHAWLQSAKYRGEIVPPRDPAVWEGGWWFYGGNYPGSSFGPRTLSGDIGRLKLRIIWCEPS